MALARSARMRSAMKKIWIRPALKSDAPLYAEYAAANSARSLFDMNVLTYPNTSVYVAHSGDPVMFLPVQMAAVLESLAPKPGLPRSEQARALAEIVTSVVRSEEHTSELQSRE